jgi:hypothetical protein
MTEKEIITIKGVLKRSYDDKQYSDVSCAFVYGKGFYTSGPTYPRNLLEALFKKYDVKLYHDPKEKHLYKLSPPLTLEVEQNNYDFGELYLYKLMFPDYKSSYENYFNSNISGLAQFKKTNLDHILRCERNKYSYKFFEEVPKIKKILKEKYQLELRDCNIEEFKYHVRGPCEYFRLFDPKTGRLEKVTIGPYPNPVGFEYATDLQFKDS